MTAPVVAESTTAELERFAAVAALDALTSAEAAALWSSFDVVEGQSSFERILPGLMAVISRAQSTAAEIGSEYVAASVRSQGGRRGPRVRPGAFAGIASDGDSLESLLAQSVVRSYTARAAGLDAPVAQEIGARSLERVVVTQVQDAARVAEAVAVAATPDVKGYLRSVEPGACGPCVILAGRFYRWSDGFDRHPKCRCSHHPTTREVEPQDPVQLFEAMSREEQDRAFTVPGAEAIRLGAGPAKVVNARKGMTSTVSESGRNVRARKKVLGQDVFTTTVGTKRGQVRLMPESILQLSQGDRDEAVRLLQRYRFI